MKLSSDFYKVQISTNYEKIILKFVVLVLSITLARLATMFALCKGNNSYKKKTYNFTIRKVQKIYYKNKCLITKHKKIVLSFFMMKEGSEL